MVLLRWAGIGAGVSLGTEVGGIGGVQAVVGVVSVCLSCTKIKGMVVSRRQRSGPKMRRSMTRA